MMKKRTGLLCLLCLLLLLAPGCRQEKEEKAPNKQKEEVQQEQTDGKNNQENEVPTLTALPTATERMEALQSLSEEGRKAYNDQVYTLLNECSSQDIQDGLKKELETWSAQVEGVTFTEVSIEVYQDPLLMWSNGNKRQYRNITANIQLFYAPTSVDGEEKQVMEPLLEEAQQIVRQSPYSLKLNSAWLAFTDQDTDYPNYTVDNVSVGLTGEDDPASPISSEEQTLQTLAYEKIVAFNDQEFSGEQFQSLPYANMTLSRFGVTQESPVLECEVRIQESNGEDAQAFAQKLEALAQELADEWMGESAALDTLGLTTARITFDLRYASGDPLIYEFPLGGA